MFYPVICCFVAWLTRINYTLNMAGTEEILWERVRTYLPFLQMVPFLKMLSVCNNLAFSTVNEKSDIDVFIVAKRGRLFVVRSIVTFLLHVLGVRRHDDKVAGRFCLSFFVDEEAMDLSAIALEDDVYLAYWLRSMLPIIENERGFASRFMSANLWAKAYFEDSESFALSRDKFLGRNFFYGFVRRLSEFSLSGRFGNFVERKLKKWQLKRALAKAASASSEASLIISEHILKFHNVDRRRKYRRVWFDTYGKEKLSDQKFRAMKSIF